MASSHYPEPDSNNAAFANRYKGEPRENPPSRQTPAPNVRQQPNVNSKMTSAPDHDDAASGVSPELIAAITEKVKKELVEHLKQTGSVDDQPKSQPLQRESSHKSYQSNSTSSPPPTNRRVYTPPSPTQQSRQASFVPPMEPARSPPTSPVDKSSGVRFSNRENPIRPAPGSRYSNTELSTIDQKWGRLFDAEGNPTQRLGQFLRGLANHIIDEFTPKKSIVVTPSKMASYYASHALEDEIHPLLSIFRTQSYLQISELYQDLGCQHHLIQENSSSEPNIPALTPVGFAHWMTIYILAYPEEESKRLEKVVLAMPINADGEMVDGKPERLPKQISRHLLPDREDRKSRKLLDNAINDFLDDLGTTRSKGYIASPPLSRHSSVSQSRPVDRNRTSPPGSKGKPLERERMPYAGAPSVSDASSNDESVKIERDRKPYVAQPGNGKVYSEKTSNLGVPSATPRPSSSIRSNSASRVRDREPRDLPISDVGHKRTQSNASQTYRPIPSRASRRTSSPPLRNYSNSTPGDIDTGSYGSKPSSYTSSTYPPPPSLDRESTRDSIRDKRTRPHRQNTDEESRIASESINNPRDAERLDRLRDMRAAAGFDRGDRSHDRDRDRDRDRGRDTAPVDRDLANYEDYYRGRGRTPERYGHY